MSEADLKINAKVRKLLVESNYDLSCVWPSTSSGVVLIRGELKKLGGRTLADHEVAKALSVLETVILRTRGVKRVSFYIQQWQKKKGKWTKNDE